MTLALVLSLAACGGSKDPESLLKDKTWTSRFESYHIDWVFNSDGTITKDFIFDTEAEREYEGTDSKRYTGKWDIEGNILNVYIDEFETSTSYEKPIEYHYEFKQMNDRELDNNNVYLSKGYWYVSEKYFVFGNRLYHS